MTGERPETFYVATAAQHTARPRLATDIDTNVCVVGGGFAGLWTARALLQRDYDVVLLEGREIAGEASGRNAGLVSAGYAERLPRIVERVGLEQAKALYQLSRDGVETVRNMIAEGISGLDPVPGRLNVQRIDDEEGARRAADFYGGEFGHEMLVWPRERVRESLLSERYYQALHDADAFSIHPLNLARALADGIEAAGGRIFENTAVLDADLDGVRKTITTANGRVRAHHVVFCGSAFIGAGFPLLARSILPVSTYICVTEPMAERLAETIRYAGAVTDTRRAGDYYRIVGDRLLWGGRISTRVRAPRRLGRRLARDMTKVYPQLKGSGIDYAWHGIMGYAVHKMPQIGMMHPGAWIASAFGGHGLNTTAMAGELIASAIADRDERWRLFIPFGLVWAGGSVGRRAVQLIYWGKQLRDRIDEVRSRARERKAARRAAAEAGRRQLAEERAAREKELAKKQAAERAAKEREEGERARQADAAAKRASDRGEKVRRTADAAQKDRSIEDASGTIADMPKKSKKKKKKVESQP